MRAQRRSLTVISAALLLGASGVVVGAGMTLFGLFFTALAGALIPWLLLVAVLGLFVMGVAVLIAVEIVRGKTWARWAGIALTGLLAVVVGLSAAENLAAWFGLLPNTAGPNPTWPLQMVLTVVFATPAVLLSLPASAASFRSDANRTSRR